MNIVYLIVEYDFDDKSYDSMMVFSNLEAAEKYKKMHNEKIFGNYDSIKIIKLPVVDNYV